MSTTNSNINDATVESNVRPEYDDEIQKKLPITFSTIQ